MTLFGTVVDKGQFFKRLPSANDYSGYYTMVEALWTLDISYEWETFFTNAQCQWSETYSKDPQVNAELLKRANPVCADEFLWMMNLRWIFHGGCSRAEGVRPWRKWNEFQGSGRPFAPNWLCVNVELPTSGNHPSCTYNDQQRQQWMQEAGRQHGQSGCHKISQSQLFTLCMSTSIAGKMHFDWCHSSSRSTE